MTKQIELAKKLKALADKGIGGEKANAERMLKSLMEKHNITFEQIACDKIEQFWFIIKKGERQLLIQIVKRVNWDRKIYGPFTARKGHYPGNWAVDCTAAEYIQMKAMFDWYSKLFREEYDVFFRAFLTANDLLATPTDKKQMRNFEDLSPDEQDKIRRAQEMSESVKSKTFRKQLTNQ